MSRRLLQLGNAITIVVAGRLRNANVMEWHKRGDGRFRWKGYSGTYGELRLNDEGVTWIRDHHELNAPEARALLAANKLEADG